VSRWSSEKCTLQDDAGKAGDAQNNGGMGGPELFWADLYNFTSLHSNPPFKFIATTFQRSQENVIINTKRKHPLDTKCLI
jgi:hypothetical protein